MKGMFSCKQVAHIISESLDKPPMIGTRIQLWMHLGMCGICKAFRGNMIRIDDEMKKYAQELENDSEDNSVKLSAECRERINRKLESLGR